MGEPFDYSYQKKLNIVKKYKISHEKKLWKRSNHNLSSLV